MQYVALIALSLLILHGAMLGAAAIAVRTGNGGVADVAWTFAVGLAAALASVWPIFGNWMPSPRAGLVTALILVWSLRLGLHLARRNLAGGKEDARYAELRRAWGGDYSRQMVWFLQLQALAAAPLVLAVALAAHRPGLFPDLLDFLGVAVFALGLFGAWQADRTLEAYKTSSPHRKAICDWGLWAWSRHPNYFFEWVGWCAWPLIALDVTGEYPIGLLAIVAPAFMYYLLVHVSGIPPAEQHMQHTRGAEFAAYKARVPAFFPRAPSMKGTARGL